MFFLIISLCGKGSGQKGILVLLPDLVPICSGVPCEVVDYEFDTIHCITGPAPPETNYYPGKDSIACHMYVYVCGCFKAYMRDLYSAQNCDVNNR